MNECCNKCSNYKPAENWIDRIKNSNIIQLLEWKDRDNIISSLIDKSFTLNKIYRQFYLRCIIEAVAELVNEKPIDWNDRRQDKWYFVHGIEKNAIDMTTTTCYKTMNIYFTKDGILKAKKILIDLNGMDILTMNYKGE